MKQRLDLALLERAFFQSRERARASIMAGIVYVDGQKQDKAGTMIDMDSQIVVKEDLCPYVSRGGLKLERALDFFGIRLESAICMDIGASTGGFTDCMLKRQAAKVYCIDVGYGQLDWKLRNDPRVVNMEKVNIRYLERDRIPDAMDFISIDVSFISLKLVFPAAAVFLKEEGRIVCLIKPQFEAGRAQVGKNGIVRDKAVHAEVLEKASGYASLNGLNVIDITYSPMRGAKGNIEYLMVLSKTGSTGDINRNKIRQIVDEAHDLMGGQ